LINKLVVENLRFRPVRTMLSILAIGVEVMMLLTIVGLSRGMLADSRERASGIGADIVIRPPGSTVIGMSSAPLSEKYVAWAAAQPHVALAVGSMNYPVSGLTVVTGIDLPQFNRMSGGFRYLSGGPPRAPRDIVVDNYYAQQNDLHVGSNLKLMNTSWRVSGIIEPGKLARIVVPLNVLQDLTGSEGKLTQIYVKVDKPADINLVLAHLKKELPGFQIFSMREFISMFSVSNVPGLQAFIAVVIGLSVVVGFLVVFLSMYTAVLERTREIGILKALGASPFYILNILFRETFLVGVLGSAAGIGLSYLSRLLIMTFVPATIPTIIVPDWWPIAAATAIGGALMGAVYPGWRAARQDPIEALSYE
jgi:putative ABC transport system permease protein